jgi:lysozyme family protein
MAKTETKTAAITKVIEREGGYVFHPSDRGGPTRYGITQKKAKEFDYTGHMAEFPVELAYRIYAADFWDKIRLDEIAAIDGQLATVIFDFAVNSGVSTATRQLQRLLNVLNQKGTLYPDLVVDGVPGSKTVLAVTDFAKKRGSEGTKVLTESLNSLRIEFCVRIMESDESQEAFGFGWLHRIVNL